MKITAESELMKNQIHADVMSPTSSFQALQTNQGHSLFFSIGDDNIFYLTQETPSKKTGWVKSDLSSGLSQSNGGAKITAKTFDVSQNQANGSIDLVLGVTVNGNDLLYVSLNNSNTDTSWAAGITWQLMTYDDSVHNFPKIVINDVYIAQATDGEAIVVDILKDPSSSLNFIYRYYIDPTKRITGKVWNPHDLSADLEASKIQSVLGKRATELVNGIYTLGQIGNTPELIYTPLYNAFSPNIPANPVRLTLPNLASAIAVTPNTDGTTNLFVAGDKALYFFAANHQSDGASGVLALQNDIFANVQSLFADATATQTIVWGLNQLGDVFYTKCPKGQETTPTSWSPPMPLLTGVEQIASYLNYQSTHSVIFAHTQGQNLIQLSQDPSTAIWQQRSILLPSTDVNDVVEYNTFTTHITVTGDDNLPLQKPVTLAITSKSQTSIYVENVYHLLSPTVPTNFTVDATGTLSIVQETQTLSAVEYIVASVDLAKPVTINPMDKMMGKIAALKNEDDLQNVTLSNGKSILPDGTTADQKTATFGALQQFALVNQKLGGSPAQPPAPSNNLANARLMAVPTAAPAQVWGMSFDNNTWAYHENEAAMNRFGIQTNSVMNMAAMPSVEALTTTGSGIGDAIVAAAEDIFSWLKHAWDKVTHFFVQLIDDAYHFFIQIGEQLYRFVLDTVNTIVQAVEFVFNKIKVFFEDLVQWLGFIFNWGDILRTHSVIKNILKQYVGYCVDNVEVYKTKMSDAFVGIENSMNEWANLPQIPDSRSVSNIAGSSKQLDGGNSPQSQWGTTHLKQQSGSVSSSFRPSGNLAEDLLNDLLDVVNKEKGTLTTAYQNIKDLLENINSLSLNDIFKKLVVIIADLVVDSAKNVLVAAMNIIESLIVGVMDILDASIDIPIISWLYKKITGNDLSALDLFCLVIAIPTTIIYKVVVEDVPFPDNAFTTSLINAPDFASIQKLYTPQVAQPNLMAANMMVADVADAPAPQRKSNLPMIMNLVGLGGAAAYNIMTVVKYNVPDSALATSLSAVSYLPYIAPDLIPLIQRPTNQKQYEIWNEVFTFFTVVKTLPDIALYKYDKATSTGFIKGWGIASPIIECGSNLLWEIPVVFATIDDHSAEGIVSCVGNSFFNLGGVLAPGAAFTEGTVKEGFIVAMVICTGVYGIASLIIAAMEDPNSQ